MRGKSRMLALLAVCLVLAHSLGLPAAAQNTTVRVWPEQASTTVGQVVELVVQVNDVVGLMGLDVRLAWDPALLVLVDSDDQAAGAQALPGDLPLPDYVVRNVADNEAGTLRYAVSQTGEHQPVTGSGTAVTLRLQALATGEAEVALVDAKLVDAQGDAIQAERAGAVVQISGEQPATPSPTPGPDGYPEPEAQPSATELQGVATPTLTVSPETTAGQGTPTARPRRTPTARPRRTPSTTPAETAPASLTPGTPSEAEQTVPAPAAPTGAAPTETAPAARATLPAEPTPAPAPAPSYPLIPSEWFVCLGIGLLLGTLGLFLYLSRGGQVEPRPRLRTRLR